MAKMPMRLVVSAVCTGSALADGGDTASATFRVWCATPLTQGLSLLSLLGGAWKVENTPNKIGVHDQ